MSGKIANLRNYTPNRKESGFSKAAGLFFAFVKISLPTAGSYPAPASEIAYL